MQLQPPPSNAAALPLVREAERNLRTTTLIAGGLIGMSVVFALATRALATKVGWSSGMMTSASVAFALPGFCALAMEWFALRAHRRTQRFTRQLAHDTGQIVGLVVDTVACDQAPISTRLSIAYHDGSTHHFALPTAQAEPVLDYIRQRLPHVKIHQDQTDVRVHAS